MGHYIKAALWAVLFFCLCLIPAHAAPEEVSLPAHGISLTVPDGFTVLDAQNAAGQKELLESLGMDAEQFAKNMKASGTLLFAVTPDGKNQLNLKVIENELAGRLHDLSELTPENREEAGRLMIEELSNAENMTVLSQEKRSISGTWFFKVLVRVSSADGEFCFAQYFSIFNGKYYALVYYNNAPEFSEQDERISEDAFASLRISRSPKPTAANAGIVLQIIFIALVVLAATGGAAYIIYTFVRDIRRERREREAALDRISRRRY